MLTNPKWRWTRAISACAVILGPVGCDSYSGSGTPTATPAATQHVLRVQASAAGSGTVIAPDALPPLACTITAGALSGTCAMAYPSNSAVRLVATPNGASTFSGWSGACTGTGDCVVDMMGERTVTAVFAQRVVTLLHGKSIAGALAHRRSIAGFRVKNPTGNREKPTCATGMTGQSSGRGMCVTPVLYHVTTSSFSTLSSSLIH
jgi:hypothetical protein